MFVFFIKYNACLVQLRDKWIPASALNVQERLLHGFSELYDGLPHPAPQAELAVTPLQHPQPCAVLSDEDSRAAGGPGGLGRAGRGGAARSPSHIAAHRHHRVHHTDSGQLRTNNWRQLKLLIHLVSVVDEIVRSISKRKLTEIWLTWQQVEQRNNLLLNFHDWWRIILSSSPCATAVIRLTSSRLTIWRRLP